ncbi:MFS transporter [Vitreoscilla massiliensis]|uniref:MFS transporter n=1 Tax=Vitreoscilla massiliensis TaxID=1689272 RepID=A0ABY4E738_9NEIS|nr:MFS transporter [Vitreoscilla massiliensis]UOO91146.1 MFS transporter [Vitreoscilla massiliensis]
MQQQKFFYGWWVVLALMLVTGTSLALVVSTFNIYLNPVSEALGISKTQFALCSTIINLAVLVAAPKLGALLQKDTRKVLLLCLLGFYAAYAAFAWVSNLATLYVVAAVFGLFSAGSTVVPTSILVNRWFVARKGLAMSIALSGSALTGMVLAKSISYFIQTDGYGVAYQTIAACSLIFSVLLIVLIIRNRPEDKGLQALGADNTASANSSVHNSLALVNLSPKELRNKPFHWAMLVGAFLAGLVGGGIVMQLPVFLQDTFDSDSVKLSSTLLATSLGVMIFAKILLGWLYDRIGTQRATLVVTLSIIATCTPFFLIPLLPNMAWQLGLMGVVCWGLGNCVGTVTPSVMAAKTYGNEYYGQIYGNLHRTQYLGIGLGAPLIAKLVDLNHGSWSVVWLGAGVLIVVMLAVYLFAIKASQPYRQAAVITEQADKANSGLNAAAAK